LCYGAINVSKCVVQSPLLHTRSNGTSTVCHAGKAFQSDLEKKAKKWQCKLCGEKQSLQRVFARSNSNKDCRLVVQQLNAERGRVEEEEAEHAFNRALDTCHTNDDESHVEEQQPHLPVQRWQAFCEDKEVCRCLQHPCHELPCSGRMCRSCPCLQDEDGCTLAVPERPSNKRSRKAGPSDAGGRKQLQPQQDNDAYNYAETPDWSPLAASTHQPRQKCRQHNPQQQQYAPAWQSALSNKNSRPQGGAGQNTCQSPAQTSGTAYATHKYLQQDVKPWAVQQNQAGSWQQQQQRHVANQNPGNTEAISNSVAPPKSSKWGNWVDANDDW
jgi:hypothetical protein